MQEICYYHVRRWTVSCLPEMFDLKQSAQKLNLKKTIFFNAVEFSNINHNAL